MMIDLKVKLVSFIKTYKYATGLCVLLFVLSLIFRISYINTYVLVSGSQYNDNIFKHLLFAILNAFILFSWLLIFSKTFLRIPVAVVLAFLTTVDIGLMYIYKAPMNNAVAASIFETNLTEARDILLHSAFIWLPAFALFCFVSLKASTEIKANLKKYILIPVLCLAANLIALFAVPLLTTLTVDEKKETKLLLENIKTSSFVFYLADKMPAKYPFVIGDIFLTGAYLDELMKFNRMEEVKMPQGIALRPVPLNDISKIILVVGESARRENHSLYGYTEKTTPFLDSLSIDTLRLSYYKNVISPSNFTRDVLRMTFSYAIPSDVGLFMKYKNLVKTAKDAGYKTCWISAQDKFGSNNSIMNLIANTADTCFFHTGLNVDDLDLPLRVQSSIEQGQKQFMVVHLNGSHWPYHRFDDEDTAALGSLDEVKDYDKTIHHTDRVLREIYRIAQTIDENVLVYYFSDHGEIISKTNGMTYNMHGLSYKYKIQYHVPLVIMQNRPFIHADSIVNRYYDQQTGRLNTLSNIYILSELLGYQVSDSLVEQSKIDGRYVRQGDGSCVLYEKIKD
jgi:glucan phosphoethanolaminetransferase (alkaline phosphatase superfamily)